MSYLALKDEWGKDKKIEQTPSEQMQEELEPLPGPTPKAIEDELRNEVKELKAEIAEQKKTLMKLKGFTNKAYHYLFFPKDEKVEKKD